MKAIELNKNKLMIFSLFILLGLNTSWNTFHSNVSGSKKLSLTETTLKGYDKIETSLEDKGVHIPGNAIESTETIDGVTITKTTARQEVSKTTKNTNKYYVYPDNEKGLGKEIPFDISNSAHHKLTMYKTDASQPGRGIYKTISDMKRDKIIKDFEVTESNVVNIDVFTIEDCDCKYIGSGSIESFAKQFKKATKVANKKKRKTDKKQKDEILDQLRCEKEEDLDSDKLVKIKSLEDRTRCLFNLMKEGSHLSHLAEEYEEKYDEELDLDQLADEAFEENVLDDLRKIADQKDKKAATKLLVKFIKKMGRSKNEAAEVYADTARSILARTLTLTDFKQLYAANKTLIEQGPHGIIAKLNQAKQQCYTQTRQGGPYWCTQQIDRQIKEVIFRSEQLYKDFSRVFSRSKTLMSGLVKTKFNTDEVKDLATIYQSENLINKSLYCGTSRGMQTQQACVAESRNAQLQGNGQGGVARPRHSKALVAMNKLSSSRAVKSGDLLTSL